MIRALVKSTSFQQRRILKAKIRSTTYPCTEMIVQLFTDHQELEEFLQDINLRYMKIYAISIIYHLLQWSINYHTLIIFVVQVCTHSSQRRCEELDQRITPMQATSKSSTTTVVQKISGYSNKHHHVCLLTVPL